MRLIYGLAERNARAAERLYHERFSNRDSLDHRILATLHYTPENFSRGLIEETRIDPSERFKEYGSLRNNSHSEGGPRCPPYFVPCMEQNMLDTVWRNPSTMLRVRVTHGLPLLSLLSRNDVYSYRLGCKLEYIQCPGASPCGYLSRYNLSAARAFPSANS
ncbi:hypothetical protein TNCV_1734361 [Trichonephila clavipes]|nr:hypothetical protein TNCV_1734361 [Trichonephila clavipes]